MTLQTIGLFGASGRMGRTLARLIPAEYAEQARISALVASHQGRLDDFSAVDVIIDFSLPSGTETLLEWLESRHGALPAVVSGTTGLDDRQRERLARLGTRTRVLYATNFSPGVAALAELVRHAAPIMQQLGYTPSLTETHHFHKKDKPSGTAKTLCRVINPADPDAVEVHSIREGEIIGQHEVTFAGPSDRITIGHEALNRDLFARGAIEAALWLCAQPGVTGHVTMRDYFARRYLR